MSKRVLALLLILLLLLSLNTVSLSAADGPTVTLESKTAVAGDPDVTVAVRIDGNPGIWGMDLKIHYDSSAMTLVSVDNGDFFQASEWMQGNLSASVYTLSYEASGFADVTAVSGTLAVLHFSTNEAAPSGTYAIKAEYRAGDIINVSFDEIAFEVTNGSITLSETGIPVTGIALDHTAVDTATGDGAFTLIPIFTPQNATNQKVMWESSDPSVATVSDGTVTPHRHGSTTVTVTTEDGGFRASCVVTVKCSHLRGTAYPAVASTCTVHGHGAYSVCDDCGEIFAGSDAVLPLLAHTFAENPKAIYRKTAATWDSGAVYYKSCTVCGEKSDETFVYGDPLPQPREESTLRLDREKGILYVPAACTSDTVRDAFAQTVTVTKYGSTDYVGTGSSVGNADAVYYVVVLGDVNGNGTFDSNDALLLRAMLLETGAAPADSRRRLAADLNGNGRIDSNDYILLRRSILGLA